MQPSGQPDRELPLLTYSTMVPGRRFEPASFAVTEEVVREFIELTQDANPLYRDPAAAHRAGLAGPVMPPGLSGVWARWSYVARHRMLPGGVMAGQRYALRAPVPVGETLILQAEVVEANPDDPRRRVLLECSACVDGIGTVGLVGVDARWPEDLS
jgi:acyl dehydratase